ncbi:MAG: hypothetical protein ABW185_20935 [Sedimenticola sp.]
MQLASPIALIFRYSNIRTGDLPPPFCTKGEVGSCNEKTLRLPKINPVTGGRSSSPDHYRVNLQ